MSKTILITGGAGFIAHHLVDKVLAETDWRADADPRAYASPWRGKLGRGRRTRGVERLGSGWHCFASRGVAAGR